MRFGTKHCAWLALAFCAVAIYGSFVPFRFAACSWNDAVGRLWSVCNFATRPSRSDFAANILLFVPIGFFLTGTLTLDRAALVRWLAAALVPPGAFVLSVAIEFAQIYFPPRTPSLNDVIAQAIGAATGVALWLAAGQRVVEYVRAVQAERAAGAPARLLPAYLLVLLLVHVMPLDLTISPVEVYHKYKEGRIVLLPFSGVMSDGFISKLIWNMSFFAPLGYLCAAEPFVSRRRDCVVPVPLFGLLVAAAVELAQLPVRSRSFDTTDIVTGTVGVLIGCQLARVLGIGWSQLPGLGWLGSSLRAPSQPTLLLQSRCSSAGGSTTRSPARRDSEQPQPPVFKLASVAAWLVLLMGVHWRPFDFADGLAVAQDGVAKINWIPFADYLVDSEYHAFDELHRKFLLFLPLGGLLAIYTSPSPRREETEKRTPNLPTSRRVLPLTAVLAAAIVIEAGQILLPARYPSLTDVLAQFLGGWTGVALASWMPARGERSQQAPVVPLPAVS
jgi:glycopeptide antibiotics resistance protein